jgi:hypothetical protein
MSQALVALKLARTYLHDNNAITWTDAELMPLLQVAHSEMVEELKLHQLGTLKAVSARITIPALALDMGVNQPTNIIDPISLVEGDPGADIANFQDMVRTNFIPFEDQTNWLTYWSWIGEKIVFLGANTAREVILRYTGSIATPQYVTDQLGIIFAENFIAPRIVSLAFMNIGKPNQNIEDIAQTNLYKIIQHSVVDDQRPTRRRSYRSGKGCYSPGRSRG